MKDSSPDPHQMSFMAAGLMEQLNPKHPLLQLARTIPSDLVYFRKRVGEKGFEKILTSSITIHGEKAIEEEVCIDTRVQEKTSPFPPMQSSTERL